MSNLLNAEFYKLLHSQYLWGITAFSLFLSSLLLLDSMEETSDLFFASLYNAPILYFLVIVFATLFIGNDFKERTLQLYIIAGHKRDQVLFVKLLAYQIAGTIILALPLILHGFIGKIFLKESIVNIDLSTILTISVSLFTMFLMPFFFAFLFRDIGKTLSVPLILFFLMILLMNGDHALFLSKILPMGQLRLISLHPFASSLIQFVLIDFLWIFILYMGAYWTFKRSDLK